MKTTTDIWFASFLKLKGYDMSDYEVIRPRKVKYHFDISDEDHKQMRMEFFNHDIGKVKQIIEQLKDLGF